MRTPWRHTTITPQSRHTRPSDGRYPSATSESVTSESVESIEVQEGGRHLRFTGSESVRVSTTSSMGLPWSCLKGNGLRRRVGRSSEGVVRRSRARLQEGTRSGALGGRVLRPSQRRRRGTSPSPSTSSTVPRPRPDAPPFSSARTAHSQQGQHESARRPRPPSRALKGMHFRINPGASPAACVAPNRGAPRTVGRSGLCFGERLAITARHALGGGECHAALVGDAASSGG